MVEKEFIFDWDRTSRNVTIRAQVQVTSDIQVYMHARRFKEDTRFTCTGCSHPQQGSDEPKWQWVGQIYPNELIAVVRVPSCFEAFTLDLMASDRTGPGHQPLLSQTFAPPPATEDGDRANVKSEIWSYPSGLTLPQQLEDLGFQSVSEIIRRHNLSQCDAPPVCITASRFFADLGFQGPLSDAISEQEIELPFELTLGGEVPVAAALATLEYSFAEFRHCPKAIIDLTHHFHRLDALLPRIAFFARPFLSDLNHRHSSFVTAEHGGKLTINEDGCFLEYSWLGLAPLDEFGIFGPMPNDSGGPLIQFRPPPSSSVPTARTQAFTFVHSNSATPFLGLPNADIKAREEVLDKHLVLNHEQIKAYWNEATPEERKAKAEEWLRSGNFLQASQVLAHLELLEQLDGAEERVEIFLKLRKHPKNFDNFRENPQLFRAVSNHRHINSAFSATGINFANVPASGTCTPGLIAFITASKDFVGFRQWVLDLDADAQQVVWECAMRGVNVVAFQRANIIPDCIPADSGLNAALSALEDKTAVQKLEKILNISFERTQRRARLSSLQGSMFEAEQDIRNADISLDASGIVLKRNQVSALQRYLISMLDTGMPTSPVKLSTVLAFHSALEAAESFVGEQFIEAQVILADYLNINPPNPQEEREWWHNYSAAGPVELSQGATSGGHEYNQYGRWEDDIVNLKRAIEVAAESIAVSEVNLRINSSISAPCVLFYTLNILQQFIQSIECVWPIYDFAKLLATGNTIAIATYTPKAVKVNLKEFTTESYGLIKEISTLSSGNMETPAWRDQFLDEYKQYQSALISKLEEIKSDVESKITINKGRTPYTMTTISPALKLHDNLVTLSPWFASRKVWLAWLRRIQDLAEMEQGWGRARRLLADVNLRRSYPASAWPEVVEQIWRTDRSIAEASAPDNNATTTNANGEARLEAEVRTAPVRPAMDPFWVAPFPGTEKAATQSADPLSDACGDILPVPADTQTTGAQLADKEWDGL